VALFDRENSRGHFGVSQMMRFCFLSLNFAIVYTNKTREQKSKSINDINSLLLLIKF